MLYTGSMKTMTVREVRHQWPVAEKALAEEGGVLVTRDGKPVAQLMPPVTNPAPPLRPFDAEENRRWQEKMFGKGKVFDFKDDVSLDREDRA